MVIAISVNVIIIIAIIVHFLIRINISDNKIYYLKSKINDIATKFIALFKKEKKETEKRKQSSIINATDFYLQLE